jgi:hypothetical protein
MAKNTTITIAEKEYICRLGAQRTTEVEKKLNKSITSIFLTPDGDIMFPKLGEMLFVLQKSIINHVLNEKDMLGLYDAYVAEGGSYVKLMEFLQQILDNSGFFDKGSDETEAKETTETATAEQDSLF